MAALINASRASSHALRVPNLPKVIGGITVRKAINRIIAFSCCAQAEPRGRGQGVLIAVYKKREGTGEVARSAPTMRLSLTDVLAHTTAPPRSPAEKPFRH